jgi:hypothetical protein
VSLNTTSIGTTGAAALDSVACSVAFADVPTKFTTDTNQRP